jgi:zinc and cadmium transporter
MCRLSAKTFADANNLHRSEILDKLFSMSSLAYVLIFSFIGSIVSLLGGALLLLREGFAHRISHHLASFAAGALIGAAFFDLLPEALELDPEAPVFAAAAIGLIIFFLLERLLHWFHFHGHDSAVWNKPVVSLVVVGDTIHNLIDGIAIGGAFLVSTEVGIVTAIAAAAHEIPQEIGDFGILIAQGVKRSKVFLINVVSAFVTIIGAVGAFYAGSQLEKLLPIFLGITGGFFLYIAAADLIPDIHGRERRSFALAESGLLICGVIVIYLIVRLLD